MQGRRISEVIAFHPRGDVNVCNMSRYFSQNYQKYQPADDARGNSRGPPKSGALIPWGPWMSAKGAMAICPIAAYCRYFSQVVDCLSGLKKLEPNAGARNKK